jgi:MIP family channel proteins
MTAFVDNNIYFNIHEESIPDEELIVPSRNIPLWQALTAEFIGTFILVFIGAGAAALTIQQGGTLLGTALAFGLVLMTLIYTLGSYSGGHFNLAVSFGVALSGRMNWWIMIAYWIVQLIASITAAALIVYFLGTESGVGASVGALTNTEPWKAVLIEAFATFFLVMTVLFVTRNPMLSLVAGVAIGLVLTFDILAIGYWTGGSVNPSRSFGPAIFSGNISTYWIDLIGPLLGGLFAALVYKLFVYDFSCCYKTDECGNKILDECGKPIKICKRPLVDNCGNAVKDCGGSVYETYIK